MTGPYGVCGEGTGAGWTFRDVDPEGPCTASSTPHTSDSTNITTSEATDHSLSERLLRVRGLRCDTGPSARTPAP
ncbi:hypothetical protein, partial [Streptomyces sp. 35G-GA-8]|uniref:hypothetical protein n=1 Tax=Streptomyces sp. 35G-GA-8 TaxID=2939434 RepID=UPI00201F0BC0